MKCICGYEGKKGTNERDFITDRKIFLKMSVKVQVEHKKYYMYICPSCGLIKIDLKGETK
jgi:hypothetical protein